MNSTLKTLKQEGRCFLDEPMSKHTTWGVGGPATIFVLPKTTEQLVEIVGFCEDSGMRHIVIGNGSNLLFCDDGFCGVVISTAKIEEQLVVRGTSVTAQAGTMLSSVAKAAYKNGLSGLEWAVGIPGTVGGGVVQNAGAFGREIGDVVSRVLTYEGRKLQTYPKSECQFAYRTSVFKNCDGIVLDACFVLKRDSQDAIKNRMKLCAARRMLSQPTGKSAGSVFKSCGGFAAGYLIEKAGLKGQVCGGAQISDKHANFIVNNGGATAQDIINLIDETREKVHNIFGVWLETEIEIVKRN